MKGIGDVGSPLQKFQPAPIRGVQEVYDILYISRNLRPEMGPGGTTTFVPSLQFMKKEEVKRGAGDSLDLG